MSYDDIYLLENILDQKDIEKFNEYYKLLKESSSGLAKRTKTANRANFINIIRKKEQPEIHSKISEQIMSLLPFEKKDYEIFSMNFYHVENPSSLHCDNLGEDCGFYQCIIPLEVSPKVDTFTIVYDQISQENTEWIAPIFEKPKDYKPFVNKPIYDATYYEHWSDESKISDQDGEKYWGENWHKTFKEAYHGFSIKYAYKWSIGDVFCFRSHFLHSATDFKSKGIEFKDGILVCLKKTQSN